LTTTPHNGNVELRFKVTYCNIWRNLVKDQGATKKKVEAALAKIRPHLQADGGDVELVDVTDGKVKVKLTGACGGCPMAAMTLHRGVERVIKEQVPEVVEVVEV
jgi:Fe-S cluster biogenesis protein NfuA